MAGEGPLPGTGSHVLTWQRGPQSCVGSLLGQYHSGGLQPHILSTSQSTTSWYYHLRGCCYCAAAKSHQSGLTLCNLIDGSPTGSSVPGILQARTLEWVAISFSNAWKWKVKVKSLSHVWLLATRWTVAYQAPLSMGFSRQEYWSGLPLPSPTLGVRSQQMSVGTLKYSTNIQTVAMPLPGHLTSGHALARSQISQVHSCLFLQHLSNSSQLSAWPCLLLLPTLRCALQHNLTASGDRTFQLPSLLGAFTHAGPLMEMPSLFFSLANTYFSLASFVTQMVKNLPTMQETRVWSLGQEDLLEKGMATHSSIIAWKIPWREELGGLQSMGSQRVRHNWMISNTTKYLSQYPDLSSSVKAPWCPHVKLRAGSCGSPGCLPVLCCSLCHPIWASPRHSPHACMRAQSRPTLCDSRDCGHQTPLFMEFSRQEYWSGLWFRSSWPGP